MRFKLFASLLFVILLASCNKSPEACIELDKTSAAIGETITFTSCSKHALSYIWRMEGPVGAPENEMGWSDEMIQVDFSVPGSYTVTLTAYSKFSFLGESTSTSKSFVIN